MSKSYRPHSGTAGADFQDQWCGLCERDREFREGGPDVCPSKGCQILAATFRFDVGHPEYPKEWITDEKGPRCTAFTTDPSKPVRCDKTADMFA